MTEYVEKGLERYLSFVGVNVDRSHNMVYVDIDVVRNCEANGHSSTLNKTITQVVFNSGRQKYGTRIPYDTWVTLGKPQSLIQTEQKAYRPATNQ